MTDVNELADWRDMTFLGSAYEQQFDALSGCWRHRPLYRQPPGPPFEERDRYDAWRSGPAPDFGQGSGA